MKVYVAMHKETGEPWYGRKRYYETPGSIKSAMKTSLSWGRDGIDKYDIYEYELKDGRIVK